MNGRELDTCDPRSRRALALIIRPLTRFERQHEIKHEQNAIQRDDDLTTGKKVRQQHGYERLCNRREQPQHTAPRGGKPHTDGREKIENGKEHDRNRGLHRKDVKDRLLGGKDHVPLHEALIHPENRNDAHESTSSMPQRVSSASLERSPMTIASDDLSSLLLITIPSRASAC